jgi:hypothetical protein
VSENECVLADDIAAVAKIVGREVTLEDGKQYMRTDKLLVDFTLGKSRFRIRDYINDGNILGKPRSDAIPLGNVSNCNPAAQTAFHHS